MSKYRLPDGRQVQRPIGPAWTDRGRPRSGFFTKRTAEAWLRDVLDQGVRETLPGLVRTGATFEDAAAELQRFIEHDRQRKPSTLRDYRSVIENHLSPAFGGLRLEDVTVDRVERWQRELSAKPISNRQKSKILTIMHGLMARARRVWRLPLNPAADLDKPRTAPSAGIDVLSREEVLARARAAEDEQDAAIYVTAAFTGLRQGELVALRWRRDVDFGGSAVRVVGSFTNGELTTPKSGKVRSVPMAPEVAELLARLGQRGSFTGDDDVVFVGRAGGHLDASALLRRYKRALKKAHIRRLRFSRSAAHVRDDDDPAGVDPAGQVVDGAR